MAEARGFLLALCDMAPLVGRSGPGNECINARVDIAGMEHPARFTHSLPYFFRSLQPAGSDREPQAEQVVVDFWKQLRHTAYLFVRAGVNFFILEHK